MISLVTLLNYWVLENGQNKEDKVLKKHHRCQIPDIKGSFGWWSLFRAKIGNHFLCLWPDHHGAKFFVGAHNCCPIPSNVPSRLQLTTKSVAKYAGTYQMSAGHPVWFTVVIVPPPLIGPDITILCSDWLPLTDPEERLVARAPENVVTRSI